MTEEEWLACTDPRPMLDFLRGVPSERKLRLFACACCRHAWGRLPHLIVAGLDEIKGIEVAEGFADGSVGREELDRAFDELEAHSDTRDSPARFATAARIAAEVSTCATFAIYSVQDDGVDPRDERVEQVSLLRDLFGNPFRPVTVSPAWQTPQLVALAQAAYEERELPAGTLDPARLAVLADALEEAGCTDADILNHLGGPGPHVRGCWAVDLLLGKS